MRVIRVFPERTSFTPTDNYAFVGDPPMMRPDADEVHISCTFTWHREEAQRLAQAWGQYYPTKLGGVAFGSVQDGYMPGKYNKIGVTYTSRGCNNRCPWCLVHLTEGPLFEYEDFSAGHIIQDNNFNQCSRNHQALVFEMLRYQGRSVILSGGIDSKLVDEWFVEELKTVRIKQIFLACDTKEALKPLRKAVDRIGLNRHKLYCYVLLKFNKAETISEATERLIDVYNAGAMPFAQLYQPPEDKKIEYPKEWRDLARTFSRPAATKAYMKQIGESE